ncbi:hydroxyacylglutathione hydrolase [Rosenbergiella collisarenosi]|uniref:hydroxyacylglutathione hydrolase n=1 Tax=Rosenbergiella collisarenosi TaxID=1544695 RepID=UPI001BDA8609|nr:hydroxyacylglutathione hydrolase [Rosenbergiella collisarenosi]MBT0720192.1 hydroxyacylglutathione hydrolase [Rosenbergiella collisarenosi]
MSLTLTALPALDDNYIWALIDDNNRAIIVDPGEAQPVLDAIAQHRWELDAILLTHHHADHTGGVKLLTDRYPAIPVYGPQETLKKGATQHVEDGDSLELLGHSFSVIATPGHTLGHIVYYAKPYLFCGDTLFSGGCGRLFEGTADQMFLALTRLNQLPKETLVCCAHEYTLSNLNFAHRTLPQDSMINEYRNKVKKLRENAQITLPTTLETERLINLFLMTERPEVIALFEDNPTLTTPAQRFAELRRLKDQG